MRNRWTPPVFIITHAYGLFRDLLSTIVAIDTLISNFCTTFRAVFYHTQHLGNLTKSIGA